MRWVWLYWMSVFYFVFGFTSSVCKFTSLFWCWFHIRPWLCLSNAFRCLEDIFYLEGLLRYLCWSLLLILTRRFRSCFLYADCFGQKCVLVHYPRIVIEVACFALRILLCHNPFGIESPGNMDDETHCEEMVAYRLVKGVCAFLIDIWKSLPKSTKS